MSCSASISHRFGLTHAIRHQRFSYAQRYREIERNATGLHSAAGTRSAGAVHEQLEAAVLPYPATDLEAVGPSQTRGPTRCAAARAEASLPVCPLPGPKPPRGALPNVIM